MTNLNFRLYSFLTVILLVSTTSYSRAMARAGDEDCDPNQEIQSWKGKYHNRYGFSVLIPRDLEGLRNSPPCMVSHGVIIPLSQPPYDPERHIEIYAGYEALDRHSTRELTRDALRSLRGRGGVRDVRLVSVRDIRLGGLAARRLTVSYFDTQLGYSFLEDRVAALRESYEYEVYLRSPATRYKQDLQTFERILASWAVETIED